MNGIGIVGRAHRYSAALLALAGLAVCLSGCGGKIPETSFYILEPGRPAARDATPTKAAAIVVPLDASEPLITDKIVYRESAHKVGFYEYHRWAEDPRTSITGALAGRLRARSTFQSVSLYDGRTKAEYTIRGRIERLEEVDDASGVSAKVTVSLRLISELSRETLWESEASSKQDVTDRSVENLVAQLSVATGLALDQLCDRLDAFVRARPAGSG